MNAGGTPHRVGQLDEFASGSLRRIDLGGLAICIARLGDEVFAIADACTHEETSLSDGELVGEEVECPMHGSRFDVRTGAVRSLPATEPVQWYRLGVEDGHVVVDL